MGRIACKKRRSIYPPPVISSCITISLFIFVTLWTKPIESQFSACPKACFCDEENLEIVCKEYIGASGLPHTLNGNIKRMKINNASTSTLSSISYLDNLEVVDLAHNKISNLDLSVFYKNLHLTHVNLSHNLLNNIDDLINTNQSPEHFTQSKKFKYSLIELDLSHNYLTTIKNSTYSRTNKLRKLDLSYNSLTNLEDSSLVGLFELQYLSVRANRLKQIPIQALASTIDPSPSSLFSFSDKLSSIKYLDLAQNDISTIEPESFRKLENLEELDLSSCSVLTIHEQAFKGLKKLIYLNLDMNRLFQIPSVSFEYFVSLKYLTISSNPLIDIAPYSFYHLRSLEELQINNSTFKILNNHSLAGLYYLKKLELTNNPEFGVIQKGTFHETRSLQYLNLSTNALNSLPDDSSQSTDLRVLDLRNNLILCGCETKWLTKWFISFNRTIHSSTKYLTDVNTQALALRKSQFGLIHGPQLEELIFHELVNITCMKPAALANRSIIDLPMRNLECLEPSSRLNVNLGFGCLFLFFFVFITISLVNYCRYQRHVFVMLKQSIVHHHHLDSMTPFR